MVLGTKSQLEEVKAYLRNYIVKNQLQTGFQLPSETDMAKIIGVSRNTIREAYITLEAEGIIVRRHGIGTFIARPPLIHHSQNDFSSFSQRIEAAGYTVSFRKLSISNCTAPPDAYAALGILVSEKLCCVERVILANDTPAVYIKDYFSLEISADDIDMDAIGSDMVEFIKSAYDLEILQLHTQVQASLVESEIASYLQNIKNKPVLHIRSTIYTVDNKPIVYSEAYLNPDFIIFEFSHIIRDK